MSIVLPQTYQAVVTDKAQWSPKIWWLEAETSEPLHYQPGQYGSLLLDNFRRPLSFATPSHGQHIEFIVDVSPNGVASQFTKNCEIGQEFAMLAPYGRFVLAEPITRPLLFIATGSGIAPIRAHIQHALTLTPIPQMTLLFGNMNEEYMFLDEELQQIATEHPEFTYIPALSEPSSSWTGFKGWVTAAMVELLDDLTTYDVYVCGNPAMVKDTQAILTQMNVPKEQIHFEQF